MRYAATKATRIVAAVAVAVLGLWVGGSANLVGAQQTPPPAENAEFCDALVNLADASNPSALDPASIQEQVALVSDLVAAAAAIAPDGAADLMATWTSGTQAAAALLEPVGYDVNQLGADELNALISGIGERRAASVEWASQNCPAGSGFPPNVGAWADRVCTVVDGEVTAGRIRLYLMNSEDHEVTVVVGDQTVVLPAGYSTGGDGGVIPPDGGMPDTTVPGEVPVPTTLVAGPPPWAVLYFDEVPTVTVDGEAIAVDIEGTSPECTVENSVQVYLVDCGPSLGVDTPANLNFYNDLDVPVEATVEGYGTITVPPLDSVTSSEPGPSIDLPSGSAAPKVTVLGHELTVHTNLCALPTTDGPSTENLGGDTTTVPTTTSAPPHNTPAKPVPAQPKFTG